MAQDKLNILTYLLTRAVSMQIKQARIIYNRERRHFYIFVPSMQLKYWRRFKVRYPKWLSLARKYHTGRNVIGCCCPEFNTREDLINWLSAVLELTEGERNFLYLDTKIEWE